MTSSALSIELDKLFDMLEDPRALKMFSAKGYYSRSITPRQSDMLSIIAGYPDGIRQIDLAKVMGLSISRIGQVHMKLKWRGRCCDSTVPIRFGATPESEYRRGL